MLTAFPLRASPQQVSQGPGAAIKATDRDLSNVQFHGYSTFGNYRKSCPNNPTDDRARAVGNNRRMEVAEEVFGVHITKPPPAVTLTVVPNTNMTITRPT